MSTTTLFTLNSEGKPALKTVAPGYTSVAEYRQICGWVRLADFVSPCAILTANDWEKENEGAVAYLEVSNSKEQSNPLHAVRKINFVGKSVVRWVDGNGDEQTSRILKAGSTPVMEPYYAGEIKRHLWRLEQGEEIVAYEG